MQCYTKTPGLAQKHHSALNWAFQSPFSCIQSSSAKQLFVNLLPSAVHPRELLSLVAVLWQLVSCCADPNKPSHTGDAHGKIFWFSLEARPSMVRTHQHYQVQTDFCC